MYAYIYIYVCMYIYIYIYIYIERERERERYSFICMKPLLCATGARDRFRGVRAQEKQGAASGI